MMTKAAKDTWCKGQVVSALFLDIKGAFHSIDIDRLIYNMRKHGIPKEYTEWMKWRLGNRHTMLSFDDYQTAAFIIANGLDQGDPYSGICYLLYNADLLKIPVPKISEQILLFMDNALVMVISKDFAETHEKLCSTMNRTGGIFEWASQGNVSHT